MRLGQRGVTPRVRWAEGWPRNGAGHAEFVTKGTRTLCVSVCVWRKSTTHNSPERATGGG